jgi:hypothetical protein
MRRYFLQNRTFGVQPLQELWGRPLSAARRKKEAERHIAELLVVSVADVGPLVRRNPYLEYFRDPDSEGSNPYRPIAMLILLDCIGGHAILVMAAVVGVP